MRPVSFLDHVRSFSSRANPRFLIAASIVSFGLYGLYSLNTLWEVKVDGPHYRSIIQGKDLLADVMPPPAYLVEAYLCALEMEEADGAALEGRIDAFARHRSAFLERQAYWEKRLPEGELRQAFLLESRASGLRILDAVETEVIPALRAGDRAAAHELLHGPIRREYQAHRIHIDKVTELASARHREDEARAGQVVSSRTWGQALLGLILVAALVAGARRVTAMLEDRVHMLDAISTNVTSFFREPEQFAFIRDRMAEWTREGRRRFRFRSAALKKTVEEVPGVGNG